MSISQVSLPLKIHFKNTAIGTQVVHANGWFQAYSYTIPAGTFTKFIKITWIGTAKTTNPNTLGVGARIQLNNATNCLTIVQRTYQNSDQTAGSSCAWTLTLIGLIEYADGVNFNNAITVDVDINGAGGNGLVSNESFIVEGI